MKEFKMKKTNYMKFESKTHLTQELLNGKCFANCYGNMIHYDESSLNNPFRVSYASMDESSPMTSEWDEFDQKVWVEVSSKKSDSLNVYSISIMTDKGEFNKLVLEEGVELEFNHTDHTMYFRPTGFQCSNK
jgi:hypothetical protein